MDPGPDTKNEKLLGFRCKKCGKLLAANHNGHGTDNNIEIKCARCGTLNRILEGMDEQVVITDPQGVILYVNKEVERITGYSPSEVIGQKPSLWGGRMSPEFYKNMWYTVIEKKQGFSGRVTNRHKSGRLYDALLRISPVLDSLGEIKILVGFESVIPEPPPKQ